MNHLKQIAARLPEYGLDAMLLNSEPGEYYAVGFHGEGNVVVTAQGCFYFTDSRYIEAANHLITGAEIAMTGRSRNYRAMVQEVVDRCRIRKLGFEEGYLSVADYNLWKEGLTAELVPAQKLVEANADKMMILPFAASDTKEAYAIGLPKGSELTEEFNAAMETLNENGTYDLLVQKHISNEDVELPELPSYESKGTLTMGTNAEFEPFEYVGDDGETLMGFDIDYAKYLCATMGYDLEIENMDFDALPGALQSGKVDFLAAGISITEEKQQVMDFTNEYYEATQAIVVLK